MRTKTKKIALANISRHPDEPLIDLTQEAGGLMPLPRPLDQGEGKPKKERLVPHLVEVEKNAYACDDGKDSEEELSTEIDAELHPGVFDVCQPRKISEDRNGSPQRHPLDADAEGGNGKSLDEQLRQLIPHDHEQRYEKYSHGLFT